jgi:hypothetical protein
MAIFYKSPSRKPMRVVVYRTRKPSPTQGTSTITQISTPQTTQSTPDRQVVVKVYPPGLDKELGESKSDRLEEKKEAKEKLKEKKIEKKIEKIEKIEKLPSIDDSTKELLEQKEKKLETELLEEKIKTKIERNKYRKRKEHDTKNTPSDTSEMFGPEGESVLIN